VNPHKTSISDPDDRNREDAAKGNYRPGGEWAAERRQQWDDEAAEVRDYGAGIEPPRIDAVRLAPAEHAATVAALDRHHDLRTLANEMEAWDRESVARLDSSVRSKKERTTATPCPRGFGKWIANDRGEPVFASLRCRARTCPICRVQVDESDAERITDGIGPDAWIAEVPRDQWRTVSKRLDRADATAVQCASNRDPHSVVVVADMPPTADAHKLTDPASAIRDVVATRPTGWERRLTTKGRIVSRDEWDDRQHAKAIEADADGPTDWTAPGVTLADIERVAAALGVETYTTADAVTLRCRWDDWRSVAIRRWARNPSRVEWADMYRDTLRGEGVPVDDPPLSVYAEVAA